jgi:hypothetical protein
LKDFITEMVEEFVVAFHVAIRRMLGTDFSSDLVRGGDGMGDGGPNIMKGKQINQDVIVASGKEGINVATGEFIRGEPSGRQMGRKAGKSASKSSWSSRNMNEPV